MERTGIIDIIKKRLGTEDIRYEQKVNTKALNIQNGTNIDIESEVNCSVDDYLTYLEFVLNILSVALVDRFGGDKTNDYHVILSNLDLLQYRQIEQSGYVSNVCIIFSIH